MLDKCNTVKPLFTNDSEQDTTFLWSEGGYRACPSLSPKPNSGSSESMHLSHMPALNHFRVSSKLGELVLQQFPPLGIHHLAALRYPI